MSGNRTLWEEGRTAARLVIAATTGTALVIVLLNVVGSGRIGLFFDLSFVVLCLAAALAVRPTEFFPIAVLPPLLMAGTVTTLAVFDRSAVAERDDSLVQAVVSGLAHHATALVIGYVTTLVVLALRQVALRNRGRLRRTATEESPRPSGRVPRQRRPRAPSDPLAR